MTKTQATWLGLALLYGLFFGWYTSFGGPLSDEEIAHYLGLFAEGDPAPPPERVANLREFLEQDTGDDFVMINVIDLYETPLQVEGVEPGESSQEVLGKYMEFMTPQLLARASHPVLVGRAAAGVMDLMNADGMERWTTGAGMRYRSRRDMLEIATNPEFQGRHEFKIAAMSKTIAFPVDPWIQLGDPRLVLALLFATIGCALSWRFAATAR